MASMNRRHLALCALATSTLLIATQALAAEGRKRTKPGRTGAEGIAGEWWSEERDGRIRFYQHRDGTFRGILTWSKNPRADTENDNPKLRTRSIIGIVLIWELSYENGEYDGGYVYNPEDGNVYRLDAKVLGPDKLEVRGFLGISLLGETQVWTRYR